MNRVRPVKEGGDEPSEVDTTDEGALGIIQVDRVMIGEACAEAYKRLSPAHREGVVEAIIAVAKPPESERERLGRVAYGARYPVKMWMDLTEESREQQRVIGDTVRAELDKIREEADDS